MMKNILILLLFSPILITAQTVDMDRMNRDLKVASNGLKSLIGQNDVQDIYFNIMSVKSQHADAEYIKEYGVVMNAQLCEPCFKRKKNKKGAEFTSGDIENHLIESAKTFLADYAGIIGQLEDDQKIMIRYSSQLGGFMVARQGGNTFTINRGQSGSVYGRALTLADANGGKDNDGNEIKIEASVSDIRNHFQGNMSREAFMDKVKVEKITISTDADPHLETFTAMFYRLYQKDLSSTFYMSGQPSYSKISDVGVMIKAKVYSSNSLSKNTYDMPTINKEGLTMEQRNAEVQKMLPKFEKEFKENIINYARTIRSDNDNQAIIIDVIMTQCEGCDGFPKYIKFSVSQNVLNRFNKGKLSFDQAVAEVRVERRTT